MKRSGWKLPYIHSVFFKKRLLHKNFIEKLRLSVTFDGKGKTIMGEIERKTNPVDDKPALKSTGTEG